MRRLLMVLLVWCAVEASHAAVPSIMQLSTGYPRLTSAVTIRGQAYASGTVAYGPSNTEVVISGAHFGPVQGDGTVSFAGVLASSVSLWSDSAIVAEVPVGAQTGGVVVTVNGENSNSVIFLVTKGGAAGGSCRVNTTVQGRRILISE